MLQSTKKSLKNWFSRVNSPSVWTENDACEDILQKHVKKEVKKPKKWIFPQKKDEI